ncbi:GDP-mannose--glycolipid 4-beta-D-mannosyltransferase [Epidermidibacterium keratini]
MIASFPQPRATTNPYIVMLAQALERTDGVDFATFSWPRALLGRYDVFHWHWPENRLHGSTWWKSVASFGLTALLALRHRLSRRIAVVRTVHNVELPEVNAPRRLLLRLIQATTDHYIALNELTETADRRTVILHGHYRDWYRHERAAKKPGRLATFGAVRRYKSVDAVLSAYAEAAREEPTLSIGIGGQPSSPELAEDLRERTADLPGVQLQLEFLTDDELVELATSSELVVLAYRFMHNSGSVLAALSLDRPVLVPRNAVNEALAREVGPSWVLMYDGELDGAALLAAWRSAAAVTGEPDLSRREWADAGTAHAEVYRSALKNRRSR